MEQKFLLTIGEKEEKATSMSFFKKCCIVQDETGNGLRDQDIELKELPTHFTEECIIGTGKTRDTKLS